VEQKNWAIVRQVAGYHRYDTEAERLLLNRIWALQTVMTNYVGPQQKLVSKTRHGAKVIKKYDTATTPHRRAEGHRRVEEDHDGARETLRRRQPRRRPGRDPSPHRRALDPDHRQDRSPTETRPREQGHARIRI
jgi:hypothetical protein